MADSVKFIFTTLIKVPIIIFISFFIFNIFAFFFIYFKVLGLSYVAMQEVVENNYITTSQFNQLNNYFAQINAIPMASNTALIVGADSAGNALYTMDGVTFRNINSNAGATLASASSSALSRSQYGRSKTIGIHCNYTIVWPLSYNQANGTTTGVVGNEDNQLYNSVEANYNAAGDPYTDNAVAYTGDINAGPGHYVGIPLNIYYNVPGLKYYADLRHN